MRDAKSTVAQLQALMPEIRTRFDVRRLAIFGSVARNEAREDSDVDVLVTFNGRATFDNFMGLKIYLEELFGTNVDLGQPKYLRSEIRERVEREAKQIPEFIENVHSC